MKNNKRNLRLGILWADPYCGNLGVAALSYSTIILFEEVSRRTGIRFDYTLWGASRCGRGMLDTGRERIPVRTVRPFLGGDLPAFAKGCLANPLRVGTPLFALDFLRYDLVADIGAGDSYSDIYGITRFRNMDFTKSWARRLRRQYILLPQTIGPYASEEARRKAARSMSAAGLIFARDRMSFDCARELLPQKPVERTIDAAFFLPYEKTAFDGEKTKVGINISGLLWHGGYTRNNQFGLRSDYSRTMLGILDAFSSRQDMELHLISHVIGRPDFVDEDTHVVMDFFAGARMHACIAAVSSGVPVYPLAYSRKFNGLFVETLGYPEMGDLTVMDSDEITAGLLAAFGKRSDLKKRIEQIDRQIVGPEKERMIGKLSEYILRNEF